MSDHDTIQERKPITVQVEGIAQGYNVTISFELADLRALPNALNRLRGYGVEPSGRHEWNYTPDGLPLCPKHGVPMQKREKQGDTWYSHKVMGEDGREYYCRGYPTGKDDDGFIV
jgi:hypothetical protein